jgi:hypothetical protein
MSIDHHGHEHEFEPQYGLPERLPQGESILWQASPDVATLAREAFHFRTLCVYFSALVALSGGMEIAAGADALGVLMALKWLLPLSMTALVIVWMLAWLTARTTVYTLTNKRLVMRLGIVLTVTFNLPLSRLGAADLRLYRAGFGDISVSLSGADRIGWVHLWPSSRPWTFTQPQPTVRCVADASKLAEQLSSAWSACTGAAVAPTPATAVQAAAQSRALESSPGQLHASAV